MSGYEFDRESLPEILVECLAESEPTDNEIEILIDQLEDSDYDCCVASFEHWWEENQELIDDDFEALGFTEKLLVKDWLIQAFEAGRG